MRSLGRSSSFWLALVTSHFFASPSQVASHFFASPSQVASHFFASPSQVTSHKNSDSSPTRVQVAWLESTPLLTTLCLNGTRSCVDFMECVMIHFGFFSTALPSRGGCGQAEHSATCRGSVHHVTIHVTVVMDNNTVIGAETSDRLLHINEE